MTNVNRLSIGFFGVLTISTLALATTCLHFYPMWQVGSLLATSG
ncbi:MAG TPA: hypothetical protein VK211_26650 [Kamptonema sp.]|nr:hypothetical protein [Kamptonema sp.]